MVIEVDTAVPFGNACGVEVRTEGDTATVRFHPDPHGGPECLWFYFRLRRLADAGVRRVRLVMDGLTNVLGGGAPAVLRPVARYAGGDWARLAAGQDPGPGADLPRACWVIDAPLTFVDVALCYPYGVPDLDRLVRESRGFWRADQIGRSQAGRPLVRLSNALGQQDGDRPGLFLVARQHSGETPGSWVLDGFLRRLAQAGERAPLTWAAPLANIDGVEQGDYGKDGFPYDLNRAWRPPAMRHETLVIGQDLLHWSERCRPALGLDFHAPGACETDGVYCLLPKPEVFLKLHDQAATWAEALGRGLSRVYAAERFNRVARYASRWETPGFRDYFCKSLRTPALSIETPYALCGETLMTRERYGEAGALLAGALLDMLATWRPPRRRRRLPWL